MVKLILINWFQSGMALTTLWLLSNQMVPFLMLTQCISTLFQMVFSSHLTKSKTQYKSTMIVPSKLKLTTTNRLIKFLPQCLTFICIRVNGLKAMILALLSTCLSLSKVTSVATVSIPTKKMLRLSTSKFKDNLMCMQVVTRNLTSVCNQIVDSCKAVINSQLW